MELRHLRYFVGMVEAGSLMKASERLHVAQPALSVHLSNLEIELGATLVTRSNRGIALTEDGRLLYDRALVILRHHQDAINALKSRKDKPKGWVSIGLPSTLPGTISTDLYRMVRDELPNVRLYIAEASTAAIYEWLHEGKLDLAVLFGLPENNGVDLVPLYVDEFCLVGRPANKPVAAEIEFDEILNYELVMPCRSTVFRKILDDVAERRGKALRSVIETESLSALRTMAMSGECHALLPLSSVLDDVREGRLQARKIVNPDMGGVTSIGSVSGRELGRAAVEVRNIVVRACSALRTDTVLGSEPAAVGHSLRVTPSAQFPIAANATR
jgi:LysR family nitrogen assimilation transcriptional regulator